MYKKILVALENSPADECLLAQVRELARHLGSRLVLVHVAEGWAARNYSQLTLAESEEMKQDREYLEKVAQDLRAAGLAVDTLLGAGDPAKELLETIHRERCDLVAMAGHGHRGLADLFFGSVISEVRHKSTVPLLLVRTPKPGAAAGA
jgi:nucleotide-binding universal stress UspA family protein